MKVGIFVHPFGASVEELRRTWTAIDRTGVDSLWLWDHVLPPPGIEAGTFEPWSLLAVMAVDTASVRIGTLVSCASFRNPDLVADMARTVDHLSGGRMVLGLGAGWHEQEFTEYGFDFGTAGERLARLEDALQRVTARRAKLDPPPLGPMPLLVGGMGEQVTLRLAAEHADIWNGFGPAEVWARKNAVLDEWCHRVGRDPAAVERSATISAEGLDALDDWRAVGVEHLVVEQPMPVDMALVERVASIAAARPQ